jgi:hypothetical protein
MATDALSMPAASKSTINPRRLGTLAMVANPMLFLSDWFLGIWQRFFIEYRRGLH